MHPDRTSTLTMFNIHLFIDADQCNMTKQPYFLFLILNILKQLVNIKRRQCLMLYIFIDADQCNTLAKSYFQYFMFNIFIYAINATL